MSDPQNTFYVTTPIYYVNARPHIGHVYTTVVADVVARYHRLRGDDTFFLTGTDEHGKKVADAAEDNGVSPQEYTDEISAEFRGVFERYKLTYDDFIRTTELRHKERAAGYVKQLIDQGDVYLGEYEGWYDQGQEEYVTENNAREQEYKSAVSGKPLTRVKEKNYFFRLSKYQDALLSHIDANPSFIQPDARKNEVLSRIRGGLNDIAISRSTEPWGIPMPGDPEHSIYVWIDALFNYITATEANNRPELWPADLHLIGKEILWFHAVIWPAMLMALDKPLFGQLYAHSYWISDGKKMSKSLGNFVDLPELDRYVETFGLDALRWYFATQGPLGTTDSDFTESKFIEVYNNDLANTFGNSASRVANMIGKYFDGALPDPEETPNRQDAKSAKEGNDNQAGLSASNFMFAGGHPEFGSFEKLAEFEFNLANTMLNVLELGASARAALDLVSQVDAYIERTSPFKMAKDPEQLSGVGTILYNCAEALRIASVLLWPFIPDACEKFWSRIGCSHYAEALANNGRGDLEAWVQWGQLKPGTPIEKGDPLFPRYQVEK